VAQLTGHEYVGSYLQRIGEYCLETFMSAVSVGSPSRVNQASLQNRKHSQADALPQPNNNPLK